MKTTIRLVAAAAMALSSLAALAAPPKVVAHRGYWQADGASQNSIRALVKADSVDCYAAELDVWLTADGTMIVNHDPTINGINIQTATAAEVTAQKLANGENVPTLEQYLAAAAKLPNVRLVLELKKHADREQERRAVAETLRLVKKYGHESNIDYITFSREGMTDFIAAVPQGTPVYYLTGELSPAELKALGAAGLDYSIGTMKAHPQWFKEAHDLDMQVNVWTVDTPDDMQWCIDSGADFITTNAPELLQSILRR